MVEIKRSRPGQSFLEKPVGVVDVTTGREKVFEAKARMFESISNTAFKIAGQMQKAEATEAAQTVKIRNTDGQIEYPELEHNFGASNAEYERIVQKRYLNALDNDAKAEMLAVAQQAQRDNISTEDFKKLMVSTVQGRVDSLKTSNAPDEVIAGVSDVLFGYASDLSGGHEVFRIKQAQSADQSVFRTNWNSLTGDINNERDAEIRDRMFQFGNTILDNEALALNFTPATIESFRNNITDAYVLSSFKDELGTLNAPLSVQQKLLAQQFGDPAVEKFFGKTVKILQTLDPTRATEFLTRARNLVTANTTALKEDIILTRAAVEISGGGTQIDYKDQTERIAIQDEVYGPNQNVTNILGLNVRDPEVLQALQAEGNINGPMQYLVDASNSFLDGGMDTENVAPYMQRLAVISDMQQGRGRTLIQYLRKGMGERADKVYAKYQLFTQLEQAGVTTVADAFNELNQRNLVTTELQRAQTIVSNLEGRYDSEKSPGQNIQKALDDYELFDDLPYHSRKGAQGMAEFIAGVLPNMSVAPVIKEHIQSTYFASEFMENSKVSSRYSMFPNPPEKYFGIESPELTAFKTAFEKIKADQGNPNLQLRTTISSDAGAQYSFYDPENPQVQIVDGNGSIIRMDTLNFLKAGVAQANFRNRAILNQRQALIEKAKRGRLEFRSLSAL